MQVIPGDETLGATIEAVNLADTSDAAINAIVQALGRHGVIRFPRQTLSAAQLKAFSARLGELEINVIGAFQEPGHPEVMIVSNIIDNGKPHRTGRCGTKLACRHVLQQDHRVCQCSVCAKGSAA